jgi:hypothetical protein
MFALINKGNARKPLSASRCVGAPAYRVLKANGENTGTVPPEFGDIPGASDKLIGRDAELEMLRGTPRRSLNGSLGQAVAMPRTTGW